MDEMGIGYETRTYNFINRPSEKKFRVWLVYSL